MIARKQKKKVNLIFSASRFKEKLISHLSSLILAFSSLIEAFFNSNNYEEIGKA